MTSPEQDTITVDALVFGAGAGGMTAALVCALEGLDVLLCEKTAQVGGTTATSAGTIWVIGTRQARDIGSADSIDDARRYLDAIIGPSTDNRRDIYLTTGKDVVEYLESRSEVKFSALHASIRTIWSTAPARRSPAGRWRRCRSTGACSARISSCCGRRSANSWRSAA